MPARKKKQLNTLPEIVSEMLSAPYPISKDPQKAIAEIGIVPTCGAYLIWGMINKAAHGDAMAAKLIKELYDAGRGGDEGMTGIGQLSDAMLFKLSGLSAEGRETAEGDGDASE